MKKWTEPNFLIRLGILVFWTLFWFFSSLDKVLDEEMFLWVGRNRFTQFIEYFSSIGIENEAVAIVFLGSIFIAEVLAFVLLGVAFAALLKKDLDKTRIYCFWGTFVGLVIFSFFAIGDQLFGDHHELLEHTTYWIALIISWRVFVQPLGSKGKFEK